jgi:hypothetical protein
MIPKEFDLLAREDVHGSVSNLVSGGKTIEYKEQVPGNSDV